MGRKNHLMLPPEFLASREGTKIEVECKYKTIDAGRMVVSQAFYRLADAISKLCMAERFMGEISISVPERIPSSSNWSKGLIASLQSHLNEGLCQFELHDNTEIKTYLLKHDNVEVSKEYVIQKARNLHIDHPYLAFISSKPRDAWVNMLYIRLASKNRDRILSDILDEIRDARKQFSESHAALICCFIPEIDSFEHLREPDSGLALMTSKFFSDHAKDFIYGVLYISDEQAEIVGSQVLSSSYPTLLFRNPEYNEKYGVDIPLYRNHL